VDARGGRAQFGKYGRSVLRGLGVSKFGAEGQSRIFNELSEWFTDKIEAEVPWSVRRQAVHHGLVSQWISVSHFLLVLVGDRNVEVRLLTCST